MLREEIARYIAQELNEFTWDENIFVDHMAKDPAEAAAVIGSDSPDGDFWMPNYRVEGLQIIVRSGRLPTWAQNRGEEIYDLLHGMSNQKMGDNWEIISMQAIAGGPTPLGRDDSGRFRFSFNFTMEVLKNGS